MPRFIAGACGIRYKLRICVARQGGNTDVRGLLEMPGNAGQWLIVFIFQSGEREAPMLDTPLCSV